MSKLVQAGGTAKRTTVAALAALLGRRGTRVHAVDMNPQASLTRAFGLSDETDGLYTALTNLAGLQVQAVKVEALARSHDEDGDIAVKAFELSQSLMEKWLTADYSAKRRILEIVCLNFRLDDVSLIPIWRKPFDVLAERPFVQSSRGDWI